MKRIFKNVAVMAMFIVIAASALAVLPAQAQPDLGLNYASNLDLSESNADPRDLAVSITKYLMTFLGIIAVIIILYGGFMWMTAAGNEDRVASAKKIIVAGAIGLVVILAAFVIVQFVLRVTNQAINGEITG